MTNNFAITRVDIRESSRWQPGLLKILKQGTTYQLSRYDEDVPVLDDEFFGKNITVSAIVGKNGSGKSTLLDIIYRVINNVAHCIVEAIANHDPDKWNRYHHLDYCYGMFVNLRFVCDGEHGTIVVRDDVVGLMFGEDKRYVFRPVPKEGYLSFYKQKYKDEDGCIPKLFEEFEPVHTGNIADFQNIASKLFYSIVTSYAMQSFLSSDYQDENTLWSNHSVVKSSELQPDFAIAWIDALFHKNDGYTTPIVLNPFRNHGVIDMQKEKNLTLNRVASLLLYYHILNPSIELIDGYTYGSILFRVDSSIVISKCAQALLNNMSVPEKKYEGTVLQMMQIIEYFNKILNNTEYLANFIVREYGFKPASLDDEALKRPYSHPLFTAQMYLVYKTLAIATKLYPGYEEFYGINVNDYIAARTDDKEKCEKIKTLIKKINSDPTHIALKIRQTKRAIKALTPRASEDYLTDYFGFEDYSHVLDISLTKEVHTIQDVQETMPPSFFIPDIFLRREGEEDPITLSTLSTGERQMVFTISTLVYHSLNILSVRGDDRLKYNHFCYILDEVEICFHPEYQRLFINTLISTIQRLGLNEQAYIHILLSTHSPFILSDIPNCNILYLREGQVEEKNNPFAANVNEILADSFFLSENGYIGEFARRKLLSLKGYLEGEESESEYWDMNAKDTRNPKLFIRNMLSDSLLKKAISDLTKVDRHAAN